MAQPSSSAYPSSLDSAATLGSDQVNAKTFVLKTAVNTSATSIVTTATISGFAVNNWILIDSEVMWFTGLSTTTASNDTMTVVRGQVGPIN